jgi:hypothetical protein
MNPAFDVMLACMGSIGRSPSAQGVLRRQRRGADLPDPRACLLTATLGSAAGAAP